MGLITKLLEPWAIGPDPGADYWYTPRGLPSQTGVRVNADTALTYSAVYACVKVLAEGVASLPLIIYHRRDDGGKDRASEHPLYDLLHDQPNRWQTSFEWREMSEGHLALRGNAYSKMIAGPRGFVDELIPLHPDSISVELLKSGNLRYRHRRAAGFDEEIIEADRMFHLRGLSSNGLTGLSVVSLAREAVGLGLAAEGYGARLFSQDATPGGIIQYPGSLSPEATKRIKASWQEQHSGLDNAHQVAILDEGMAWQSIGMTSRDAQFLEVRQFEVADVARWFRIPPHMIGDVERSTSWGTGIEQQTIGFIVYTMLPWYTRWEQRIKVDLIQSPWFFAEFLIDGLLRGDMKQRYEAYGIALDRGIFNVNEVRNKENMNPVAGGDVHYRQLNMTPIPAGAQARTVLLAREAAARAVRRETNALARAAKAHANDTAGWQEAVRAFYAEHASFVATALCADSERAVAYTARQEELVLERGVGVVEGFEQESVAALVNLAMGEQMPDADA